MMKFKKCKLFAVLLATTLFICACTAKENIPELQEPVGSAPSYRPLEKIDMGDAKIILGTVSGTDYCHYFEKSNVAIKEIKVCVGQYVEKGDVLVEADIDSVKEQVASFNSELTLLNETYAIEEKIHDATMKRLQIEKEQKEYQKNLGEKSEEDVNNAQKAIDIENENYVYNQKMYEFNKRKLSESINELNKIVNDGVIKAKSSGIVTYVKDLKNGTTAASYENIVIVTDDKDLFIAAEMDTRAYQYKKYNVKFAFINGRKVPISEFKYTDSEEAFAKAQNVFPVMRFKTDEEVDLKIGDFILLEFYNPDKNGVLAVGKDSYMSDDEGLFVYVKNDDGSVEKKHFEGGTTDEHYIEVVSGLEEGEMILYTHENNLPKMSDEYEVTLKTFSDLSDSKGVKFLEKSNYSYISQDKGEIDTIYVRDLQEVKKGEPLFRITLDSEKGDIVEIDNKIKKENREYEAYTKTSSKTIENLYKAAYDSNSDINSKTERLNEIKKQLASETDTSIIMSLAGEKSQLEEMINRAAYDNQYAEIDMEIEKLNAEIRKKEHDNRIKNWNNDLASTKKENDGTGYKTIYAKFDGIISSVNVSEGDVIDYNKKLAESVVYFDDLVKFGGASAKLPTGFDYKITIEEDEFHAHVISGNTGRFAHIFTEDGKVKCTPAVMDTPVAYIKVDEDAFYNMPSQFSVLGTFYESMKIDNVLAVPGDYVFEETSFDKKKYNYVWIKNGDEVYKKYVTVGTDQNLGNRNDPVIINGVKVGDILVK